jgi:hypothetical protein
MRHRYIELVDSHWGEVFIAFTWEGRVLPRKGDDWFVTVQRSESRLT